MEQIQESSQYWVLIQVAIGAVTLIIYNVSMSTLRIAGFHWYKPTDSKDNNVKQTHHHAAESGESGESAGPGEAGESQSVTISNNQ